MDYAWPVFSPDKPGGLYIIEALRRGDTMAFKDVVQQFLFDHPEVGQHLDDELEQSLVDGTALDEWELTEHEAEQLNEFYKSPTVLIQFLDVPWSGEAELRAEDLAHYSQEIEEIAMTLKSVDEKLDKLLDAVTGRDGLMERVAVIESKLDAAKEEAGKSEGRLNRAIEASEGRLDNKLKEIPDRNEVGKLINDNTRDSIRYRIAQWIAFGLLVATLIGVVLAYFKH